MTSDLPAYLDAQLAAIEDTARAATPGPWGCSMHDDSVWAGDDPRDGIVHASWENTTAATLAHIARMDPAFTLAWCAAIRAVVAMHSEPGGHECVMGLGQRGLAGWYDREDPCCPTLRALAQPFAGGEGWQEGWAL